MTLTIEQEINDFFKKEYLDLNDFFDRMNNDLGVIGGTEKMDELKIVDDKLFPKLKKIVGSNLNIKKVEIKLKSVEEIILPYNSIKKAKIECSSLKVLDLTGNRLNKIKLSDSEGNLFSPNLEKLMVSDNRLEELDKNIRDHHRLRTLFCFQNFLNEINLSEMESLEDLNASFNGCYSDYDGEIVLRNTLEFLNVENCINLKHLDADFNDISTLKVSNLFSLKDISLRANGVNDLEWIKEEYGTEGFSEDSDTNPIKILVLDSGMKSTNIRHIDIKASNVTVEKEEIRRFLGEETYDKLVIIDDETEEAGSSDRATRWEQLAYDRLIKLEKETKKFYEGEKNISFVSWDICGGLVINCENLSLIEGKFYKFPKSTELLDLSHNDINSLKVKNFPNLKTILFYSNKKIRINNITIENCPNLTYNNIRLDNRNHENNLDELFSEKVIEVNFNHF